MGPAAIDPAMIDSTGDLGATVAPERPMLVLLNHLGAWGAGALTAVGLFAYVLGGIFAAFPATLLVVTAGPATTGFLAAALWWRQRWPGARMVQLLPFLWLLGWAALIFLSPVQPQPPGP